MVGFIFFTVSDIREQKGMNLEKKLAIDVLRVLYEKGDLSLSELTDVLNGNWETVLRRIEELRAEGLIYAEKSTTFPFRRIIGLTGRGREIASTLTPNVKGVLEIDEREFLALMHALGGELKGSTKLEKFMYRLDRETDIEKCFKFTPYKYGPFSSGVLKIAQRLASMELIEIEEKIWEVKGDHERKLVTYRLTPSGEKVAKDIFNGLTTNVQEKLVEFKKDSNKPLEIFLDEFYKKYPEFKRQTKLDFWYKLEPE